MRQLHKTLNTLLEFRDKTGLLCFKPQENGTGMACLTSRILQQKVSGYKFSFCTKVSAYERLISQV